MTCSKSLIIDIAAEQETIWDRLIVFSIEANEAGGAGSIQPEK